MPEIFSTVAPSPPPFHKPTLENEVGGTVAILVDGKKVGHLGPSGFVRVPIPSNPASVGMQADPRTPTHINVI